MKNVHLYTNLRKPVGFDPFAVANSDPTANLCLMSTTMEKFIYTAKPGLASKRLGQVWQHLMLQHGLASHTPFTIGLLFWRLASTRLLPYLEKFTGWGKIL